MSIKAVIEYTDPTDFTFDPTEMEVSGGKLRLKSQVLASETSFYDFNTDGDNNPVRGTFPVIPQGTAEVIGGRLELPNSAADKITIDTAGIPTNKGSIHFKLLTNFATVGANIDLLSLRGGLQAIQRLHIGDNGGGDVKLVWQLIGDVLPSVISTVVAVFPLNTVDGHDILLSWDLDAGDHRFFVDGVQTFAGTGTNTFTIDGSYVYTMGSDIHGTPSDFSIDDLQFFNEAIKTDSDPIPFPFPEPTAYKAGNFKAALNPALTMDTINAFTEIVTLLDGQVKYLFSFDSMRIYWDGAAWVLSNGSFLQSNTAAEISANLATLPITQGVTMRLEIFLDTGANLNIAPTAESLTIDYNFFLSILNPSTCIVYGTVKDNSGAAVGGAKITFDTPDHFYGENFIAPSVTGFSGADGVFSLSLVETESTGVLSTCTIEYKQGKNTVSTKFTGITIPDDITAKLSDII